MDKKIINEDNTFRIFSDPVISEKLFFMRIGTPQCGQVDALSLICLSHSGQGNRAIC